MNDSDGKFLPTLFVVLKPFTENRRQWKVLKPKEAQRFDDSYYEWQSDTIKAK